MGDSLSNLGTPKVDAIEKQNTTGRMTPILEFDPNDGILLEIMNQVMAGAEPGIPIYAELRDSGDNDLPLDTDLVVRYEAPAMDQPQVVSEVMQNIRPYRTLNITEQQSTDYIDQVRQPLKGQKVQVRPMDTLEVAIDSSTQIDWSNSRLDFARQHVNIGSYNR